MAQFPWFTKQFDSLQARYLNHSLHHGLLLVGKKGTAKKPILLNFAQTILCEHKNACGHCQACKLFTAGNHPDFLLPVYEKSIGVDLVRKCINKLNQKSHLGGPTVLVLHDIDSMTVAACNALLKTLEEPTPHTYILMTAVNSASLLPTVLSRCEKHQVQVKTMQMTTEWLQSVGQIVEPELLELYWDRPLLIQQMSTDNDLANAVEWLKNMHKLTSLQSIPEKLVAEHQLVMDWMGHRLNKVLTYATSPQLQIKLHDIYQQLISAERQLSQQGINKQLVLERLFQQWLSAINLM